MLEVSNGPKTVTLQIEEYEYLKNAETVLSKQYNILAKELKAEYDLAYGVVRGLWEDVEAGKFVERSRNSFISQEFGGYKNTYTIYSTIGDWLATVPMSQIRKLRKLAKKDKKNESNNVNK